MWWKFTVSMAGLLAWLGMTFWLFRWLLEYIQQDVFDYDHEDIRIRDPYIENTVAQITNPPTPTISDVPDEPVEMYGDADPRIVDMIAEKKADEIINTIRENSAK